MDRIMGASPDKTILVCHGAWSGGWSWKKMYPLMQAAGYRLLVPTYTGLGDREHLAHPAIDLEAHIQDILSVIKFENLNDFVLLGHSYGGMVATGVADRVRARIAQLIYLDAFVPMVGQCLLDFLPESERQRMRDGARSGDGWRVPPNPIPQDTSPEDVEWLSPRRVHMPMKCFETKLSLKRGDVKLPRSYIYATRAASLDVFGACARRATSEAGWRYFEIDASHSPHVTAPDALMSVLRKILE